MINFNGYNIDDSKPNNRAQCPKCKELGKTHYKEYSISIDRSKQLFNCHKCSFSGFYGATDKIQKSYVLPDINNQTELNDTHLKYFSSRGITQKTIIKNGIKSAKNDWIAFNYIDGSDVINIKYRNAKEKKFMQAKDAKPIMYKLNDIRGQKSIIICEGEFDALSWDEAGFSFATSVSQGAPNSNDKTIENKLACIYNCFDIFEEAENIYLSVDSDENGQRLQRELIRIFKAEKVKVIDHGNRKDANEILCLDGKEKLIELFKNAKDVPVSGIFTVRDFESEIIYNHKNLQPIGSSTYFPNLDERWKHRPSEVTIWTGYNNEGKSLLIRQLMLIKSVRDNWKHAIFCPEDMPLSEFYTDLAESYIGKSADISQKGFNNYMTESQLQSAIDFLSNYFYVVYPDEDHTIDTLLEKFSYCVRKNNVKDILLDPYNQIMHLMKYGEREDLYISRFMTKLKKFAIDHAIGIHLVAHQATPQFTARENYPEPNLYRIKGGGTFADKADNVVSVWREFRNTDQSNTDVTIISQKIKKQKLTGIPGSCHVNYDRRTNRYLYNNLSPIDFESQQKMDFKQSIEPNYIFDDNDDEMPF